MKEKINKRTTKDSIEYLELQCIVNNRIHDYIAKYHNFPKYIKIPLWIFDCLKQTMCEVDLKIDYKTVLKENEEYSKQLDLDYVDKNYISKKKIEDELEELKGKLEDISKRREKSKTKEEKTVLWCLEIRTDERIKTLHELLENYKMNPKQ